MQRAEGDPGQSCRAQLLGTGPQREGGQGAGESGPGEYAEEGEAPEGRGHRSARGPPAQELDGPAALASALEQQRLPGTKWSQAELAAAAPTWVWGTAYQTRGSRA